MGDRKERDLALCEAAVDLLGRRLDRPFTNPRSPSLATLSGRCVDLRMDSPTGGLVVEHTRVEPFPDFHHSEADLRRHFAPIRAELSNRLPEDGNFMVTVELVRPRFHPDRFESLAAGIVERALWKGPNLSDTAPPFSPERDAELTPAGCEVRVVLHRSSGRPGVFVTFEGPGQSEKRRRGRVRRALAGKAELLDAARCKSDESFLIVELSDLTDDNRHAVGREVLRQLRRNGSPIPTHVFVVGAYPKDRETLAVLLNGIDVLDSREPAPSMLRLELRD